MLNRKSTPLILALALLAALYCTAALAGADGKKAVLIVAPNDFEQNEYSKTRNALEDAGVICTVASTKTGQLKGNKGKRITADAVMADVNVAEYDAVVVIGGNGIKKLWKNEDAHRLVREAVAQDKVLGAICAGPGILAYADVLDGKKATAHPKSGARQPMKDHGCDFQSSKVVVDGKLITGNGPKAAKAFGEALTEALN